jgi:hypothetical protein
LKLAPDDAERGLVVKIVPEADLGIALGDHVVFHDDHTILHFLKKPLWPTSDICVGV